MSVPNHRVVPMTVDDVPIISSFLQDSKLQLAINRFVIKDWPNPPAQEALYTKAVEGALSNPQATSLKVVDDISKQPVAYLFYTKQKVPSVDREVPAGVVPEVFWAVTRATQELHSDFQNEEFIGTWLLEMAQKHAADEKLLLRITAEPNHHDFFVNRGFRDIKHVDVDLTRWAAPLSGYGTFRLSSMVSESVAD
ncbi:hypothetical protein FHL15_005726 [Xylaria flabelliformis]|uniref:N-acetyltransferase domain-containing protein n=1 Tax=Xylaria flabelliformis TaxID=2512241 RepID=A0A553HZT4_9PEZI|nr:hypothetical protein FHL15_005726 [Xylaria flabelliformis]